MSARNFRKKIYASEQHFVKVNDLRLEFCLNRKSIKRLYLLIKRDDGRIIANAPRQMPLVAIIDFITSKASWIIASQERIAKKITKKTDFNCDFIDGAAINLFGEALKLRLKIKKDLRKPPKFSIETQSNFLASSNDENHHFKNSLKLPDLFEFANLNAIQALEKNEFIQLETTSSSTKLQHQLAFENFCRQILLKKITPKLQQWQEIIGVKANHLRIRKMQTRHGTCNTRTATIWLSLNLIRYPLEVVEYVLVHELVHLLEPSHNRRFVALMSRFLPNWKNLKEQMRD